MRRCGLIAAIAAWALGALELTLAGAAGAAEQMLNEPKEFRGVTWEAPLSEFEKDMKLIYQEGDYSYYRRASDSLRLGTGEILKLTYRFYKSKFSGGILQVYGGANRRELTSTLFDRHGKPERTSQHIEQYLWEGEHVDIVLNCEITQYCIAEYRSVAMNELERADGVWKQQTDDDD